MPAFEPGVLPRQALVEAIRHGWIRSEHAPEANLQPASLDLTLGPVAYRLRCSFLPGNAPVREKLVDYQMESLDLTRGAVLEQNRPYLIPLREALALPAGLKARANPRSSTGRLDIFTRVLVDRGHQFDEIPDGYTGELFLEVVPRSFTIKVQVGTRLNQLRLIAGVPRVSDADLAQRHRDEPLVYAPSGAAEDDRALLSAGLFLSVDLSRTRSLQYVGFRAKKSSALIDLSATRKYTVTDFWEPVAADRDRRLILEPEEFYLLVSRERVRIPPDYAAEMSAYEPTSGELRTHYAGFFDPGFGHLEHTEAPGTAAVLEVRAHDVSFALEHGQRLCRLTYERMQAAPDQIYGSALGSRYQRQYLALPRQFKTIASSGMRTGEPELFGERPMPLELVDADPDVVALGLEHE